MKTIGKTTKIANAKVKVWKRELLTTLVSYRVTPHPSTGKGLSMVLMDREPHTKLSSLVISQANNPVANKSHATKERQKNYADSKSE